MKPFKLENDYDDYLFYSYAYYKKDASPVPDTYYDMICRTLLERWDELEHPHKDLADEELLRCGSGFCIQYPDELKVKFDKRIGELEEINLVQTSTKTNQF